MSSNKTIKLTLRYLSQKPVPTIGSTFPKQILEYEGYEVGDELEIMVVSVTKGAKKQEEEKPEAQAEPKPDLAQGA